MKKWHSFEKYQSNKKSKLSKLRKEIIKDLQKFNDAKIKEKYILKLKDTDLKDSCSICLDTFNIPTITNCGHVFC